MASLPNNSEPNSSFSISYARNLYYIIDSIKALPEELDDRLLEDKSNSTAARTLKFHNPSGIWRDTDGWLYVAEETCIRKFSYPVVGSISIIAGDCNPYTGSFPHQGSATTASLHSNLRHLSFSKIIDNGIAVDTDGVLYLADQVSNRIKMVTNDGLISTIAGNGEHLSSGDGVPASTASIRAPKGLWIDSIGQLYVTSCGTYGDLIRKISNSASGRIISTVAGVDRGGRTVDVATSFLLSDCRGVFIDTAGVIYISNGKVHKVSTSGIISKLPFKEVYHSNEHTKAELYHSGGIVVDPINGDIYVTGNRKVLTWTASTGTVSTFVGTGALASSGDGGPASSASLFAKYFFLDTCSNLFITDMSYVRVVYSASDIPSTTEDDSNLRLFIDTQSNSQYALIVVALIFFVVSMICFIRRKWDLKRLKSC